MEPTVVYRYAAYQKNNVSLQAISNGGGSLYGVDDIPSFAGAAEYVKRYGLGAFNATDLPKVLTGKSASTAYSLGDYTESVNGSSTTKDIETMLQMVYMRFEEPRFDEEMHEDLIERLKESVANKVVTPKSALNEKYGEIVNNGDPRKLPFDQDYLEKISYDRVMEIYQERFTDASDFIFYIVGDVSKEVLRPLVEKYLGSIREP